MSSEEVIRFVPTRKTISKQKPVLIFIASFGLISILYMSMIDNPDVRRFMLIFFTLLWSICLAQFALTLPPRYNYIELTSDGINTRHLAFIKRSVAWRAIKKIDDVYLMGMSGIGIIYRPGAVVGSEWLKKMTRQRFGYDDIYTNGFEANGRQLNGQTIKDYIARNPAISKMVDVVD